MSSNRESLDQELAHQWLFTIQDHARPLFIIAYRDHAHQSIITFQDHARHVTSSFQDLYLHATCLFMYQCKYIVIQL